MTMELLVIRLVKNPFRSQAPNNHLKDSDSEDLKLYRFFNLIVQRGRVLPSIIQEDLVMTKDNYCKQFKEKNTVLGIFPLWLKTRPFYQS